jgi:hypothetical protein
MTCAWRPSLGLAARRGSLETVTLFSLRRSALALAVAVAGWAAGCAITPQPMVDPGYAARAYTPGRVAVLPPDVFVVVDQVGDNDPAQSAALGQEVSGEMARLADQVLRARGYDVDFSARWDGVYAQDGTMLVSGQELGGLANGVLAFANGPDAVEGALNTPRVVAPELAARVGAATQSEAVLYMNVKGAVVTPGKRTASVLAGVFFVAIVAVVIIALAASSKGGGNSGGSGFRGAGVPRGSSVARAPGGAWHGTPTGPIGTPRSAPIGGTPRGAPIGGWRGGGAAPPRPVGAPVYVGGGPHLGIGVGVIVPLDGPVYTHDGNVDYDDPLFAGDQLYVSMTLVSTYDGRILWHARDSVDLEADHPDHVEQMMHAFLETLPPALPRAR